MQAELKRQIHEVFHASDYETGPRKGRALIERYRDRHPQAMACLERSLEECITCLKLPEAHRRRVRTTNGLERLIEEGRRQTDAIGPMAGEQSGLSLIHAVLVDVARRWQASASTRVIWKN